MQYRKWLRQKLKALQAPNEPDEPFYEGVRSIVSEASGRAAEAGLPEAVAACAAVRRGGITPDIARQVLSQCLALAETKPESETLNAKELAELLGIHVRSIYRRKLDGSLPEPVQVGRSVRWRKSDVDRWLAQN